MLPRVLTFFVAFMLFWFGLAAPEPVAAAAAPEAAAQVETSLAGVEQGSPGHERAAGDPPGEKPFVQLHAEGAADVPALLPVRPAADAPTLTMGRPRPYATAAWLAPYLDGLQRPPAAPGIRD
ncbi:hypothetical protein V4F39_00820 [Aquincola sp. MAHUQ-54]|uniref:DUF3613 domain-containing protein n=1 Tax=Aquincola agrisoli TaxID=3119538 RepID=A0AAW9QCR4_9BURK